MRFVVFLAVMFLAACATNSKLVSLNEAISVKDFTKKLRHDTSANLDVAVVAMGLRDVEVGHAGFDEFRAFWCPNHVQVQDVKDITGLYSRYCEKVGGKFSASFCRRNDNSEEILFYAGIGPSLRCSGRAGVDVHTLERKGKTSSPEYIASLRKVGYRNSEDVKRIEAAKREDDFWEAKRRDAERPAIRQIGARICRKNGGYTEIGYVENLAVEKVQIRISELANFGAPPGWAPKVIWDFPDNWRLCEG